jgi:hypothetical protein
MIVSSGPTKGASMKIRTIIATTALFCGLGVAPAFTQTAQQDLEQYISNHPALQQNPSLMNDPKYLASHPDLSHFLQTHPQVDAQRHLTYNHGYGANNQQYGRSGAGDQQHRWTHYHHHSLL